MRILVTGGTGYVGSHTIPALLARGHDVRLLARDPAKITRTDVEVSRGDMLDATAVAKALDGCDAVLHAAAAIGVTSGGTGSVRDQNVTGTRNVLGAAVERQLDPVVHISTVAVFVPPHGPTITADSPLASPRNDYGRSKVEAERYARALQADTKPVTIAYPGGVIGPNQPHLDATMEGIAGARRTGWPMAPGGVALIDVRDLAAALAAAMQPGLGPRRLMLGGHFITWPALGDLTDDIVGARARRIPFPKPVIVATGTVLDLLRRVLPVNYPLTRDAAEIMTTMVPTEDEATLRALGVELRPLRETLEDSLRWLAAEGHLKWARAETTGSGG